MSREGAPPAATARYRIGAVRFNSMTDEELLDEIAGAVRERSTLSIVHPNMHHLLLAEEDPSYADLLDRFTLRIPDGIGVHLAAVLLHRGIFRHRQNGTDFYPKLLRRADEGAWRIYFLGDTEATLISLRRILGERYPRIAIAGTMNGFTTDHAETIRIISESSPDLLLIGMGAPLQERWAMDHRGALDCPVVMTVGAGLSFLAGTKRRAPHWMRRLGLEWLFRLFLEPARLWRRYLIGIPRFAVAILRSRDGK